MRATTAGNVGIRTFPAVGRVGAGWAGADLLRTICGLARARNLRGSRQPVGAARRRVLQVREGMALSGSRDSFAKLQCVIIRRDGLQSGPGLVLECVKLGRAATRPDNQGLGFSQWHAEPAPQGSHRFDD